MAKTQTITIDEEGQKIVQQGDQMYITIKKKYHDDIRAKDLLNRGLHVTITLDSKLSS